MDRIKCDFDSDSDSNSEEAITDSSNSEEAITDSSYFVSDIENQWSREVLENIELEDEQKSYDLFGNGSTQTKKDGWDISEIILNLQEIKDSMAVKDNRVVVDVENNLQENEKSFSNEDTRVEREDMSTLSKSEVSENKVENEKYPGVFFCDESYFLIRKDGAPVGIVRDKEEGKRIIDSISLEETKKIEEAKTHKDILRTFNEDHTEVKIISKTKGYIWSSSLKTEIVVDMILVSKCSLKS